MEKNRTFVLVFQKREVTSYSRRRPDIFSAFLPPLLDPSLRLLRDWSKEEGADEKCGTLGRKVERREEGDEIGDSKSGWEV